MRTTSLNAEEALAVDAAAQARDLSVVRESGIVKSIAGAAALADYAGLPPSQVLQALADGTPNKIHKAYYQVQATLCTYMTPLGVLVLTGLGLFQAFQTARAAASNFSTLVKKATGVFSAMWNTFRQSMPGPVGQFFMDAEKDSEPADALQGVLNLVAVEVPAFGVMLKGIETFMPVQSVVKGDVAYDTPPMVARLSTGNVYDTSSTDDATLYDEAGDVAYDIGPGDTVYDADGDAYVVQEDGSLESVS